MSKTKEEKFFEQWYDKNEKRFHHGQFSEKQIAYSAFVNGFNYNREIISELEQQKAELREALKDVLNSVRYGMQCISIETIERLLN